MIIATNNKFKTAYKSGAPERINNLKNLSGYYTDTYVCKARSNERCG